MCLIAKTSEIPSTAKRNRRNQSLAEFGWNPGSVDPSPEIPAGSSGFESFLLDSAPSTPLLDVCAGPSRPKPLVTESSHRIAPVSAVPLSPANGAEGEQALRIQRAASCERLGLPLATMTTRVTKSLRPLRTPRATILYVPGPSRRPPSRPLNRNLFTPLCPRSWKLRVTPHRGANSVTVTLTRPAFRSLKMKVVAR